MGDSPNLDGRNNKVNSSAPQQINGSKVTVLGEKKTYIVREAMNTLGFFFLKNIPRDH